MNKDASKIVCPYSMPQKKLAAPDFYAFCNGGLGVSPGTVRRDIESWLNEDHGAGDATLFSAFQNNVEMCMYIVAKETFILSGLHIMAEVFRLAGSPEIAIFSNFADGQEVLKGEIILGAKGQAAALLLAERVALNLGSRMSGVTTKTKFVQTSLQQAFKSSNSNIKCPVLLETRKTTPGLRMYEKYATRVGGARNHRHGLDSGCMLKENHLRSIGNIKTAIQILKERIPILTKIEVEVTNLDEFKVALSEQADVIMLDNFSLEEVRKAVEVRNKSGIGAKLELSGNLDLKNIEDIANCGVDYASMGALIHKASWVDMSLQLYP